MPEPTPYLTIRQLQSPRPGKEPRTLVLDGWCAPHDTIKWGGTSQRHSVRWYPGSGRAATFLDGPELGMAEIQFSWKTRQFGLTEATIAKDGMPGQRVATADALVEILESMVGDQCLVEVTWRETVRVVSVQAPRKLDRSDRLRERDRQSLLGMIDSPCGRRSPDS